LTACGHGGIIDAADPSPHGFLQASAAGLVGGSAVPAAEGRGVLAMRSSSPLIRLGSFLLLLSCLHPLRSASAVSPPGDGSAPDLPPGTHVRLAEAASDPTLALWQRDFMLGLAQSEPGACPAPATVPPSQGTTVAGGSWTNLFPLPPRRGHAAIYDPARDRIIMFGGSSWPDYFNDVWALSLSGTPAWTQLQPAGRAPSPRHDHAAIYDSPRDRIVVFGGYDASGRRNDVWALTLSGTPTWSELTPTGTLPSPRDFHRALYDPVRERMVMFGGFDGSGCPNDVWALTLSGTPAWTALTPTGTPPSGRFGHTAIYDPLRDRMLVSGGTNLDPEYEVLEDVWALTFSGSPAWTELLPAGPSPGPRVYQLAIYDQARDRMIIFGGAGGAKHNDVWALSLAGDPAWSEIVSTGAQPEERWEAAAIYDPVRDRMVIFGGRAIDRDLGDVWALTLTETPAWSELVPTGTPPSRRAGCAAIYDPLRHRMVVFGGSEIAGPGAWYYLNDVWALTLSDTPTWTRLLPAGTPPMGRTNAVGIFDPTRDRMVVFGGYYYLGGYTHYYLNDVWALTLSDPPTWEELAPTGPPPAARVGHAAIYDPARERMVVFGGYFYDGALHLLNDVWTLTLSGPPAWSEMLPASAFPEGRSGHTAIHDPVRDQMIVFGGSAPGYESRNDVWALSLAETPAWSRMTPEGTPPAPRSSHTAIYDRLQDCMVVFGGSGGSGRNDIWRLALCGTPAWSEFAPTGTLPAGRSGHAAVHDPVLNRMVAFGGFRSDGSMYGRYLNDTWALTLPEPVRRVAIDIRPDSQENPVNLGAKGVLPVAILGSACFDVSTLDLATITLAGAPVERRGNDEFMSSPDDCNRDGFADLLLHFDSQALMLSPTDTRATLEARTADGALVRGSDRVRIVPNLKGSVGPLVSQPAWPADFDLGPVQPNPSRAGFQVDFALPQQMEISLTVYDQQGRRVRTLLRASMPAGQHVAEWDGHDESGRLVPCGLYFVRLDYGHRTVTAKAAILR
jgi:hypothetical protein